MDRWRSGTPETCHSSHHHAACTRSPALSLSLQVFFFISIFFTHSLTLHLFSLSPSTLKQSVSLFLHHHHHHHLLLPFSLALVFRFHHLLWRHPSFLLSVFLPLTQLFFFFPSASFNCGSKKKRCGWMEGWKEGEKMEGYIRDSEEEERRKSESIR